MWLCAAPFDLRDGSLLYLILFISAHAYACNIHNSLLSVIGQTVLAMRRRRVVHPPVKLKLSIDHVKNRLNRGCRLWRRL
jgi:hypothetical protein